MNAALPVYTTRSDWREDLKKVRQALKELLKSAQDDDDQDFERHLRKWICTRGHWLSYDAYSRACMVVGMNQLLQAIAYHVVAVCWKISVITAIACLLLAKLLTVCVLRIDVNCMKSYTCLGGGMV